MQKDLEIIKKKYGEKMMHLCRSLFPTLLEEEGLLSAIILDNFEPSKYLYDDIVENNKIEDFKNYIYSLIDVEKKEKVVIKKTPKELLKEAGYTLYECKTEEDIQSFKKYYAHGEKLCTFIGGRLNKCHVFFAVKDNVDEIKRNAFPSREDEYGTSVISIQFTKGRINTLSIKNRYNHSVNNPDATFSNNLDNIIPGLTQSFEQNYGFNLEQTDNKFDLPGYVKVEGKYYKYNLEMNNIYYCPGNIIIDNFKVVTDYKEQEKYIVLDYFILDLVNKKIKLFDSINDSFIEGLENIEKITISKSKETLNKIITITIPNQEDIEIEIDKLNRIIGYSNNNLIEIGNSFLSRNIQLQKIQLNNVTRIGNGFLAENKALTKLKFPNLIEVGDGFLENNNCLTEISLPKLEIAKDYFLTANKTIENVYLPKLTQVGCCFLKNNLKLTKLSLPRLEEVELYFLYRNKILTELNLPNLKVVDSCFLENNNNIEKLELLNLTRVGDYFLADNKNLKIVDLPLLKKVGISFLNYNCKFEKINIPYLPHEKARLRQKRYETLTIKMATIELCELITERIKHKGYEIKEYIKQHTNSSRRRRR